MNAGFFVLAFTAALNPKLLAVDLLLIENRRPPDPRLSLPEPATAASAPVMPPVGREARSQQASSVWGDVGSAVVPQNAGY